MMKFASFENIVAAIYNYMPGTKDDYSKGAQTMVAFSGGYLAGILCAIVSHPADVMVSKLNADRAPGEGFGAAMSRIYSKIGFSGLWNGLPVRIVMIGTLTGLYVLLIFPSQVQKLTFIQAMDDLRLFQDLCWFAHNWWRWCSKSRGQGLEKDTERGMLIPIVHDFETLRYQNDSISWRTRRSCLTSIYYGSNLHISDFDSARYAE